MKRISILLVVLTLALLIVGPNIALAKTGNDESPQPVLIPVILDGTWYAPEDFNRINLELSSKGVYLIYNINPEDGSFYAFSTIQGYNEYAKSYGMPAYVQPSSESFVNNESRSVDGLELPLTFWQYNWEHINYSGLRLEVPAGYTIADLRDYNFNDEISSVAGLPDYPYNGPTYLYQHINLGGACFTLYPGSTVPTLVPYGWNDIISSLMVTISA